MGLPEILKKITDDGHKEAAKIKAEAEKAGADIIKKAEEKASAAREEILNKAKVQADLERQRILSNARLEAKKELLSTKRRLIDKVFEGARDAFVKLGPKEAQKVYKRALLEEVDTGEEVVVIGETEKPRITEGFIKEVNKALSSKNRKGNLTLNVSRSFREGEGEREGDAGFLLKGKRTQFDSTLSSLLAMVREDIEPEIAKILFGL